MTWGSPKGTAAFFPFVFLLQTYIHPHFLFLFIYPCFFSCNIILRAVQCWLLCIGGDDDCFTYAIHSVWACMCLESKLVYFLSIRLPPTSFVCLCRRICLLCFVVVLCSRLLLHTLVYRHPNSLSRPFPIACLMGPFLLHPTPLNLPDIYLF